MNRTPPHYANHPCYGCGGTLIHQLVAEPMFRAILCCNSCGLAIMSQPVTRSFLDASRGNSSQRSHSESAWPVVAAGCTLRPRTRPSASSSAASIANSTGATGAVAGTAAVNGQSARNYTAMDACTCTPSSARPPAICIESSISGNGMSYGEKSSAITDSKRHAARATYADTSANTSQKTGT